jgi:cation:H+ antiporter
MVLTFALLIGSAVAIYFFCESFVNGVEWLGHRLRISQTATGTILAAFGTALPESVVTFIAVVFGHGAEEKDIGIGAALGGPLALSTLAYSVVGLTLLGSRALHVKRKTVLDVNGRRLSRDQAWFGVIFVCKIALGMMVFTGKAWLGALFLLAYAAYVWKELCSDDEPTEGHLEPLKLRPHDAEPPLLWAACQTALALIAIFAASRVFVSQLNDIGPFLGLPAQLTALLLSPIATELPETLNAIIWLRQGKTTLALGNISGAMMIQATVPSALGLLFTPWLLDKPLTIAAGVTFASIALMWLLLRWRALTAARLSVFGLLYLVFAGLVVYL